MSGQGGVIGLVRYGAGNAGAVTAALESLGADVRQVTDAAGLSDPALSALVLPGVGAMPAAAEGLRSRGLWQPLRALVMGGMPLLGVCLGMQLLFGPSEEGEGGLDLLPGRSARLSGRRVPHLGWAQVAPAASDGGLFAGWTGPAYTYFAHSYAVVDLPESLVAARTAGEDEEEGIVAAVAHGRVYGVQFHPERSQGAGMAVLEGFLAQAAAV